MSTKELENRLHNRFEVLRINTSGYILNIEKREKAILNKSCT